MNGLLVVNGFLASAKFEDLYGLLLEAFLKRGIGLELRYSTDFVSGIGSSPVDGLTPPSQSRPDFVLFWDKDTALAQRFEDCGVRVINSAAAIAICDDKILTALALARIGLPTPATIVAPLTFEGVGYGKAIRSFLSAAGERLGYPLVIKEACGSFGAQVYLAENHEDACRIVAGFGARRFLLQEYVPTAANGGCDVRVNVVGGEAVASILRENPQDFRSNVTNGGTATAYAPSHEVAALAVAAAKAVGADFAGVDILLPPHAEALVCEVNSNPSFRSTLDATGVNLADAIAGLTLRRQL